MKQILPIATFAVCLLSTALKASEVPKDYTAMVDTTKVEVGGLFECVLTENTTLKTSLEVLEQRFKLMESLVPQRNTGERFSLENLIRIILRENKSLEREVEMMRADHLSSEGIGQTSSKPCSPRDMD